MKDIDNQIRNLQDVIYYARYVDDIFIIISPSLQKKCIGRYFIDIKRVVEREGLTLHTKGNKCNLVDLSEKVTNNTHNSFTYLGYTIHIEQKTNNTIETTFGLSPSKKNKVESRVLKSIDYYNNKSKFDIKAARRDLLLCLRYLTTNTKLTGAKNRVKTGIFYSNDLLDKCYEKEITCFDYKLRSNWLSRLLPYDELFANQQEKQQYINNLKNDIIARCSFVKGFTGKTYHIFSKKDLKTIKRILE
jgi:hypothetical protein